jgi:hypothetical protein
MKQDTDSYANAIDEASEAAKDLSFLNYTDSDGMMAIAEGLGVNFSEDKDASESEEPDPMDGDDWEIHLGLEDLSKTFPTPPSILGSQEGSSQPTTA